MAPRTQPACHSVEEINRYSLRTQKRGENNVSHGRQLDAAEVSGKEDFLRVLGLQMKRYPCRYPALHGVVRSSNEARGRANGLKLRDCSVVVLGAACDLCGKCFKCETDVNVHVARKHANRGRRRETVGTTTRVQDNDSNNNDDVEMPDTLSKYSKYSYVTRRYPATKLQSKLRLILRIGSEVVTETTVKRKHLKSSRTISMATQTESSVDGVTLIAVNDACGTGDDVPEKNPAKSEVTGRLHGGEEARRKDRLGCACEASVRPTPDDVDVKEDGPATDARISFGRNRSESADHAESLASGPTAPPAEVRGCEDARRAEPAARSAASPAIVDSVRVMFQSRSKDGNEKLRSCCTEKLLRTRGDAVNTVQLVMPVIFPIIVPNQISPVTVAAAPLPEQQQQQQQHSKTCFVEKQNTDDDVQEVLRIVRGHDNVAREINHESPNRFEQEMLARDAIKDMLRMEQQGWHLMERKGGVEGRKRKRAGGVKFDARNGLADEPAAVRKSMKTVGPESNVVRAMTNERSISRESFARAQNKGHDKITISENAKENVLTCNGNIGIPSETLLQHYGINYYIDVCEINNNTEATVQQPVGCIFIPRSAGIETMSNRPTVIDLVNDNDE
nr:uncharacterized protein LOC117221221 isoform X2 [Megalopta genalis]